MSHQDHSNCNHDHEHKHAAHDAHGDHDHDHDHVAVDPGEVIAEKSPQDQMLIGACAIAMTLLMICMGTWMQIATPTGGGHGEHVEHQAGDASHKAEPAVPAEHETHAH